jgi:hypothetical protein
LLRASALLENSTIKERHTFIGGHRRWIEVWKNGLLINL